MKFISSLLIMGCLTVAGVSHAQERVAGSALETQMTWSSLAAQVKGVDVRVTGVETSMNKILNCGKLSKLYSPGAGGMGCVDVEPTLPSCAKGEVLTSNGSKFLCTVPIALPACASDEIVTSNGSDLKCVDDGKRVEMGIAKDNVNFHNEIHNVDVTFKKPFESPPKVVVALNNFEYENNCSVDDFRVEIVVKNITKKGFTVEMNGKKAGCSNWVLQGVTWIATGQ